MTVPVWPGWVPVTAAVYLELVTLAGEHTDGCWWETFALPLRRGALPDDAPVAVYVALNAAGLACYVGKFERRGDGRARDGVRLSEHLREESKATEWASVRVIPLRDDTPAVAVTALEAAVARRLGLPVLNRSWRRRAAHR